MRAFAICILVNALFASTAGAVPGLVRDINVTVSTQSSFPRFVGSTSTHAYFIADERTQRPGLWRTDGTTAGTEQLAGLPSPIGLSGTVVLGERLLLFLTRDAGQTTDLWATDGTSSGTQRLLDNAEFMGSTPTFALFQRRLTLSESEVWRTDGTPQGTVLVVPQQPGAGLFLAFRGSATVAGKLYVVGPRELIWVSDGTAAGTREAPVDSNCCPGSRSIADLVATPDAAYFRFSHADQVWRIDPANDMVSQFTMPDGHGNAEAKSLVSTSNEAFFTSQTPTGNQLWRIGGSPGPTLLLETDVSKRLSDLRAIGSKVVFTVLEQAAPQIKTLWGSDGTVAGTQQLGAFREFIFTRLDNRNTEPLYSTGAAGEIWTTDGTPAGTGPLLTLAANEFVRQMVRSGDRALISMSTMSAGRVVTANLSTRASETLIASMDPLQQSLGVAPFGFLLSAESNDGGYEPFVSDGTAAGTRLLRNIADNTATGDSLPADFIEFNGALYFTADDEVAGRELWRSDGTSAGTRLFADLVSGPASSHPVAPFVAGNRLYFFTLAGARTLWSTDGNSAPVRVGPPGDATGEHLSPWGRDPHFPLLRSWSCPQPRAAQLGSQFYFPAFSSSTGWELWKTDGTQAGTQLAVDLRPGDQFGSPPCRVVALNNRLFFTAVAQDSVKLWSSNGTAAGTQAIETLSHGSLFGESFGPVVFGGSLYFTTPVENPTRSRLWRSNGSAVATVVYEAATPGGSISLPVAVGNRLVFTVETPTSVGTRTVELWATQGTVVGAELLATRIASGPGAMLAAGSQLFFTRTDDASGAEPWVTDGTVSGTRMIQDVVVGTAGSAPLWLGSAGSVSLFLVPDEFGDAVMWSTDGTSAQTRSIAQFDWLRFSQGFVTADRPNPYFSSTSRFGLDFVTPTVAASHLFFLGRGQTEGIELFAIESDAPAPPPPPPPPPPTDPPPRRSGGGAVDMTLLALLGLAVALQFLTAVFRRRGMIVPPQRGGNPCSSSTPIRSRR